MTHRQRMEAALSRSRADTVPVFPRDLTLSLDVCGYTTAEVCNAPATGYDADKSARCVIETQKQIGHDCVVGSIHDLGLDVDCLGGEVAFPEKGIPHVESRPIKTRDDLERARAALDQAEGRWPGYIEAHRLVARAVGQTVSVAVNVEGPVTKAGLLRGLDALAIDMIRQPDFARDLIDFATELILHRLEALLATGAQFVFIAGGSDSLNTIRPDDFLRYTIPNVRRIVAEADRLGARTVLHPHGPFTDARFHHLVDEAIATGICGFQFGENNDLSLAKERWGDRICVLGGPDVAEVLIPGPASRIEEETHKCIEQAGAGGGFVVMASCSLHRGVRLEHVRAMVDAAHRFGASA